MIDLAILTLSAALVVVGHAYREKLYISLSSILLELWVGSWWVTLVGLIMALYIVLTEEVPYNVDPSMRSRMIGLGKGMIYALVVMIALVPIVSVPGLILIWYIGGLFFH